MNILSRIYGLISLLRIGNLLITFLSVIAAIIICSGITFINEVVLLAALSASLTAGAGNVINDIWDYETDSINKPDRPLPSGRVTKKAALNLYFSLILISLVSAEVLGWVVLGIVILAHLLLLIYSIGLKKIPLLGNFVVSFLTGFVFIFGGLLVGNIQAALIPAVFAFLINFAREGIKTMEDIPGDKSAGITTFPQLYGMDFSRKLVSAFLLLLLLFTFVPFLKGYYGIEYFLIIMAVVDPMLVYVIKSLLENKPAINLNKLSFLLKLNMIFGLTAIYFGR
jgi:geranylgeranylglycerol-phosphate geranylgeranyltransferase